MKLYGILRRNGWKTPADLQVGGARSAEVGDEPDSGVRWIRSYSLSEESGARGLGFNSTLTAGGEFHPALKTCNAMKVASRPRRVKTGLSCPED